MTTLAKKNPYKLGHSLSCTKDNGCNSSLKHTRLLACHFSGLQLIIQQLYKLRRISLSIRALQQARSSGDFELLSEAIDALKVATSATTNGREDNLMLNKDVSSDR